MDITFISDTHSKHNELSLTSGTTLIHTGGFTRRGEIKDIEEFAKFISEQNFKHKIAIAGNHDFSFEDQRKEQAENIMKSHNIIYLNDSMVELDNISFWGSPIQPNFGGWAFNRKRGGEIKNHWDLIPVSRGPRSCVGCLL